MNPPVHITNDKSSFESIEVLRQEWVRPGFYMESDSGPYGGYVALKINKGWLLLANVEQFRGPDSGGIRHRLVKADELEVVPQ